LQLFSSLAAIFYVAHEISCAPSRPFTAAVSLSSWSPAAVFAAFFFAASSAAVLHVFHLQPSFFLATLHGSCFAFFMVTGSRFAAFFFAAFSAAVLHVFHLQPSFFLATLHGSCFAFFMVTGSRFAAFFFAAFSAAA